jgi:putative membrane protein
MRCVPSRADFTRAATHFLQGLPMTQNARRLPLLAAVILLPLAGCATSEKAVTAVQSAVQAQTTPTLSTSDTTFLNTAGRAGAEEVMFGKLAQTKATTAADRRFAGTMVMQHTALNQQLVQLAQSKGITPPSDPDTAHQMAYDQLQKLHGRAFDKAYLDGQVQDHQAVVAAFQTEAQDGTDPDIKAFAAKNQQEMQQHLAMAQRLDPRR